MAPRTRSLEEALAMCLGRCQLSGRRIRRTREDEDSDAERESGYRHANVRRRIQITIINGSFRAPISEDFVGAAFHIEYTTRESAP